jgi:uncharacterized membrane protein
MAENRRTSGQGRPRLAPPARAGPDSTLLGCCEIACRAETLKTCHPDRKTLDSNRQPSEHSNAGQAVRQFEPDRYLTFPRPEFSACHVAKWLCSRVFEGIVQFRSPRERLLQSVLYEISGTLIATAAYMAVLGGSAGSALMTMIALSLAFVIYAPVFNAVFDWIEWRATRRVASDRPHRLRVLHALLLEGSDTILSVPILMYMGDLGLGHAILADLGLWALHAAYAYIYYLIFDWVRPIRVASPADSRADGPEVRMDHP